MKNYRPDDWEGIKETNRIKSHDEDWDKEDIFEAGADAMLEALAELNNIGKLVEIMVAVREAK